MPHTPEVESFLTSIGPFYQIAEEDDPHSKQRSTAATSGASLAGSAGSAKPGHDERRLPEGMMGQNAKTNCGAPSCVRIRAYIHIWHVIFAT